MKGSHFFFPIVNGGGHAAVQIAIHLILCYELRSGQAKGWRYYGGGLVAVIGIILACDGIADTKAGAVFKRQPGLQKTAKLDDAEHEEEQNGQGKGKFQQALGLMT